MSWKVQELLLKRRGDGILVTRQLCTRCQEGDLVQTYYIVARVVKRRLRDGGCDLCGQQAAAIR